MRPGRCEKLPVVEPSTRGRKLGKPLMCALPVLLAMAAVGVFASTANAGSNRPHPGDLAVATKTYASTLRTGSAFVSSDVTVKALKTTTVTSTGAFTWVHNAGELESTFAVNQGPSYSTTYLYDGATTYWTGLGSLPGVQPGTFTDVAPTNGHWGESTWTSKQPALQNWGVFGLLQAISGQVDPDVVVNLLHSKASVVVDLGSSGFGATRVTHYQATIPNSHFYAIPQHDQVELDRLLGERALRVDFWTDSSGLLQKISLDFSVHPPLHVSKPSDSNHGPRSISLGSYSIAAQLVLSDYGVPVKFTLPSPGEVTAHVTCRASAASIDCTTSTTS
jgi:hypothetical protein